MECSFGTYCRLHAHVLDSNRHVIRLALGKLDRAYRFSFAWKPMRRIFLRTALEQHAKAQRTYYAVMSGDLGTHGDVHDSDI